MKFFIGMLAGMLLLWAIRAARRQSALDGWDRFRSDARHVRRFYDAQAAERARRQG